MDYALCASVVQHIKTSQAFCCLCHNTNQFLRIAVYKIVVYRSLHQWHSVVDQDGGGLHYYV